MLQQRKSASAKKADVPACAPEKDPTEKGTASAPTDPNSDPGKANMPANSAPNADATPSLTPPSVSKTVSGEEPATINMKLANTVSQLKTLINTKKADVAKTVPAGSPSIPTGTDVSNMPAKPTEKGAPKDPPTGPIDEKGAKSADAPGMSKDQVSDVKDTADKGKVTVPKDAVDGAPKGADQVENTDKQADVLNITHDYHVKIASVILATEEGRQYAENRLLQSLGQEAAEEIVKAATVMESHAQAMSDYEASGQAYADQLWNNASPAERQQIIKIAQLHEYQKTRFATELEKQAYDVGAEAAAGQMDEQPQADPAGGAAPGADAAAGAPGADGGAPSPDGGDGNQEISADDVVQVLQAMVQSGEVTPQVAEELLTQLLGGGDDGAAGGAPGGDVPPDVTDMAQKAASLVNEILKKEASAPTIPALPVVKS